MSKPVYEIPLGDESYPPASGRRSAPGPEIPDFSNPDAALSYLNAPPPAAPAPGAFTGSFPPPPPAYQAPHFEAPAYEAPPYEAPSYSAPAPAFEPPVFNSSVFDLPAPSADLDDAPPPAPVFDGPTYEGTGAPSAHDFHGQPFVESARVGDSYTKMPGYEAPVLPIPEPIEVTAAPQWNEAETPHVFPAPPAYSMPTGAPTNVFSAPAATPSYLAEPPTPSEYTSPALAYKLAPPPMYTPQSALPATSTMATAAPTIDRSPQVGEGQLGSDPIIVAALNAVVTNKASDLHIAAGSHPMIRVDGGLKPIPGSEPWTHEKSARALQSILTEEQQEMLLIDLELDFAYQLSPTTRFRVNMYQQRNHIGAAFRIIPTEIKQLSTLGVPEQIGKFAELARGLVLVTGPTGSGKSTTLAALIDLVNTTRADHIMTVEDPIEFMHENKKSLVNQREVGHDTHSFGNALKHVLRQDPDVILIGELRDLETISVALTAAETGHLVFATLHTQSAAQTVDRIIDVFPPHQQGQVRSQLAATLQGVVSQTLVKKVGGGRAVATEVLVTTSAISNLIREGKTYQITSAMQAGRDLGMHTMDQHLADLVNAGQISHYSAYEKAQNVEDLKQLIQRNASEAPVDFSQGGY